MPRGRPKNAETPSRNGSWATLGFEVQTFLAAAALRNTLEPSGDMPVAWGPICLMPISHACGKPVRLPRKPLASATRPSASVAPQD